MEVERPSNRINSDHRRREIAVRAWRDLGAPKVGGNELTKIQKVLARDGGPGGAVGPAAIARILADEGAELRHPEVIECDALWRQSQIEKEAERLDGIGMLDADKPLGLEQAQSLIEKLEELRGRFDQARDLASLRQIRTLAISGRQTALSRAKNRSLKEVARNEQLEIADWLRIWLNNPELFEQWLELRKSSTEFKQKFSAHD